MHARTHYTCWMVAEVLKICCCVHKRQIDWQVSTNDKSLPLHLAHEDLVRAWMQCYSSSSIPAAMVYFAAYDHKKRLHSSLSCAWCSHLNLLDWAQTWIKAAVVQVHTPTLEHQLSLHQLFASATVCISWVTPSSCQPFLPGHLLTAPWPSHHHASRSISTAVHWSSTGICAGSNQENRRLMLAWDFFFKTGQFPTWFPRRAAPTPVAFAREQRQQHCHRLSDRSPRGSVLFQQKVRPIAKYQLQKSLSKLELHTTVPITAGKITGISHLRQ